MKQRVPTIFLKAVILCIGIATLAFCVFLLPRFAHAASELVPKVAFFKHPFLICIYSTMIIFFFALYQAIKLLGYIDNKKVFSKFSVKTLKNMKLSGIAMTTLLYFSGMPAVYLVAEVDDAPGLVIIGFAIASMPLIVATFIAVLQKLLQEAVDIKAVRLSTLEGICEALDCQPADILEYKKSETG